MSKNYYSLMDESLKFILNQKKLTGFNRLTGDKTEMDLLKEYMKTSLKLEFYEQNAIIRQLTEDGFMYDGENCRLSLKGIQFIKDNGYQEINKKNKNKSLNIKIMNLCLTLGGLLGAIYYALEVAKMIWKTFH